MVLRIQLMDLQKKIIGFFIKAMVIAVYSIFFAVQIFFNFVSGKNITNLKSPLSSVSVSKNKQVTNDPKSGSHQLGFRLNKHFQPKTLPSGIISLPATPVCFIYNEKIPEYDADFISSSGYSSSSLRGPPQMNHIS